MTIVWIRLMPGRGDQISWCTVPGAETISTVQNFEDLPWYQWEDMPSLEVRLIVPGEQILSVPVSLPPGAPEDLFKALPFAVEDLIVEDEEVWHCVPAGPLGDGRQIAWIINRDILTSLLARIPRRVAAVVPDYACLEPATWVGDGLRHLVSLGGGLGAAMPASLWLDWQRAMQLAEPMLMAAATSSDLPATFFSPRSLPHVLPGNLLQGEFKPPSIEPPWRRWRWPYIASAAVIASLAIWFVGLGWYYHSAAINSDEVLRKSVAELFPEIGKITSLQRQIQHELEPLDLYQQPSVLAIHDRFTLALQRLPNGKLPEIQSLRFDTGKKRIQVYLSLESVEHIDILLNALRDQALRPSVEGVSDSDGRSQVTLVVDW